MMKKQVLGSYFANVYEWEIHPILEIEWLPTTEFAHDDDFVTTINNLLEGRRLKYVLSNAHQLFLFVEIDFQRDMVIYTTKKFIELGCKKLAIILPNDYISQLDTKQLIDEVVVMKWDDLFEINCFENMQEALKWLINDK